MTPINRYHPNFMATPDDQGDMDPADPNEPFIPKTVASDTDVSSQMPEMGTPEYDHWVNSMGHTPSYSGLSMDDPDYEQKAFGGNDATSNTLPTFDPSNGHHWLRGLGLFAKGAFMGAPKQAGPAPTNQSSDGKPIDQKDYWRWLFKS
jgi:hypothetical protein